MKSTKVIRGRVRAAVVELFRAGPQSKPSLATITGFNQNSIDSAVDALHALRVIVKCGVEATNKAGRRQHLYRLVDQNYVITKPLPRTKGSTRCDDGQPIRVMADPHFVGNAIALRTELERVWGAVAVAMGCGVSSRRG